MAISISKSATAGNVILPRKMEVKFSELDALQDALNHQFTNLVEKEKAPYQLLYAAQSDPKGNVTVWQPKAGVCTVMLTGSLAGLVYPEPAVEPDPEE